MARKVTTKTKLGRSEAVMECGSGKRAATKAKTRVGRLATRGKGAKDTVRATAAAAAKALALPVRTARKKLDPRSLVY
jgi:hypothetical protein